MSHIEEGKTNINLAPLATLLQQGKEEALQQHSCMVLLRQAVTLVATEHQGAVVGATYSDFHYHPQRTNTNLALTIPNRLPRGIGLEISPDTGELVFKGDPWGYQRCFAEVQQRIIQNYVVLAHAAALRRMKAQVSTQVVENQVVITGVFHG